MKIKTLLQPMDLAEAYEQLITQKDACLMAGGAFLRLQKRSLTHVIDLSGLPLHEIKQVEGGFSIGSMVTLHQVENSLVLPQALRASTRQIAGVALRNLATIGGSVMGRYAWSDLLTALVSLDAKLVFYKAGRLDLQAFLDKGLEDQDILMSIEVVSKKYSYFTAYKNLYTDFSLLNLALAYDGHYKLSIGARAKRASGISFEKLEDMELALSDFDFTSDLRASADYRLALAKKLMQDAVEEARKWK